ncbi:hypothetical protein ACRAWD_08525 [Caulobacter segnis]
MEEGGGGSMPMIKALLKILQLRLLHQDGTSAKPGFSPHRRILADGAIPIGTKRLGAAWAILEDPGGPFTVAGVHLVAGRCRQALSKRSRESSSKA